jgi:hypothetical protein
VAFYVPLGPRGLILRVGTALIGILAILVYWRASRRRAADPRPITLPSFSPEAY